MKHTPIQTLNFRFQTSGTSWAQGIVSLSLLCLLVAGPCACSAPPVQPSDPIVTEVAPVETPLTPNDTVPTTVPEAPVTPPSSTGSDIRLDGSATGTPFVEPPEVASLLSQAALLVTIPIGDAGEGVLETAKRALELVKWKEAAANLERAIGVVPNSPTLRLALARAKIRLGAPEEALVHAAAAWNSDPTRMDTATLVVQLQCRTGQKGQALEFAAKVASTDIKDANRQNIRVAALLACGEFSQASEMARQILPLDEVNPNIMKNLARAYYHEEKYEMALYALMRAAEFSKNDYEVAFIRALVLQKTQTPAIAEGAYREVLALKADHPESHNNLGLILYETGNYADAAGHFQLAFTFAPGFRQARLNFANSLRGLRMLGEAEAYYQMLLQEDPGFVDVYYNLGMLFIEEEWGNQSKLTLLSKGLEYLNQFSTLSGLRGPARAHLDGLIRETTDRIKEEDKRVADLESEAQENAAKLERFSAMATGVLLFYKDAVQLMKDSADLAASEGRQADADTLNSSLGDFQNQFLQSILGIQTTLNNREGGQLEEMLMSLSPNLSPWPGKLKGMSALLSPGSVVPELPADFVRLSSDDLEGEVVAPPTTEPAPDPTAPVTEPAAPVSPPDGAPTDDSGPIPLDGTPGTAPDGAPTDDSGPIPLDGTPGTAPDGAPTDESGPIPLDGPPETAPDGEGPPVVPEG